MPIYDYSCRTCSHQFEALVRHERIPACPKCQGQDLERHFSLPAIKSETTRQLAMRAAKQRDVKQAREADYTQRQYEKNHDNE
jgi:putative FmdB family regulatory protein